MEAIERGAPVVVPVNHVVSGTTIAVRTSAGGKLDTAIMRRHIAFEGDGHDVDTRTGWSVVVGGTADLVEDPVLLALLDGQGLRPWADPADATWISIRPDEVLGRRIRGSWPAGGGAAANARGSDAYAPTTSKGGTT